MRNLELINARRSADLAQTEIAKKSGISVVCYQNYEAGIRIPRADVAIRIAETVGVTEFGQFKRLFHSPGNPPNDHIKTACPSWTPKGE